MNDTHDASDGLCIDGAGSWDTRGAGTALCMMSVDSVLIDAHDGRPRG